MTIHAPLDLPDQQDDRKQRPASFKVKFRSNEYNDQIQLRTPSVLAGLKRYIPSDGLCLVGLTMLDQFQANPDLFVAGLASGNDGVAVFSFARSEQNEIARD